MMFGDVLPIKENEESAEEMRMRLEDAIKGIEPESWKEFGGKGTVHWIENTLIIRNTIEVHEMVAGSFCL